MQFIPVLVIRVLIRVFIIVEMKKLLNQGERISVHCFWKNRIVLKLIFWPVHFHVCYFCYSHQQKKTDKLFYLYSINRGPTIRTIRIFSWIVLSKTICFSHYQIYCMVNEMEFQEI